MRTTAMCWGFECGDGWYQLLDKACAELELLIIGYVVTHPEARNPFPWFLIEDLKWSIRHPLLVYKRLATWVKAEIWPNTAEPWWPRAAQIKEKYGTLRFYLTFGTDEMYNITDEAERVSATTCETCGKKGKVRGRGWLYTACGPCAKKRENR